MRVGDHLWEALEQIEQMNPTSKQADIARDAFTRVREEQEAWIRREDIIEAREALVERGYIRDSGERRNGRIVWQITPEGVAARDDPDLTEFWGD